MHCHRPSQPSCFRHPAIDVDGGADIAAGVDRQRIGDLYALAVDHAGLFLTGGVDKVSRTSQEQEYLSY